MMAWNFEEALSYYEKQGAPGDQTALIGLLKEIQMECAGGIPMEMLKRAALAYGVKETFLLAIVKRIPSLRMSETHILEICSGPNCGKHTALADCAQALQKTHKGKFIVRYVPCMRMCGKGPNIKWDGKLYNRATAALLKELVFMDQGKR